MTLRLYTSRKCFFFCLCLYIYVYRVPFSVENIYKSRRRRDRSAEFRNAISPPSLGPFVFSTVRSFVSLTLSPGRESLCGNPSRFQSARFDAANGANIEERMRKKGERWRDEISSGCCAKERQSKSERNSEKGDRLRQNNCLGHLILSSRRLALAPASWILQNSMYTLTPVQWSTNASARPSRVNDLESNDAPYFSHRVSSSTVCVKLYRFSSKKLVFIL